MTESALQEQELAVERARAKLSADLAILRSPTTLAQFTDDLKKEAVEAKDRIISQAQASADTAFHNFLDDLKRRAASNPAAAVAIGAGLAWRLLRNPPISSALIGLGLVSLWRTKPTEQDDYLAESRRRLRAQAVDAASAAGEIANDAAEMVQDKFRDLANSAKEKALDLVAADDGAGLSQPNFSVASSARDTVLLGIASAAVAAAVAISCQKSISKQ
jgi:hypothetical protein